MPRHGSRNWKSSEMMPFLIGFVSLFFFSVPVEAQQDQDKAEKEKGESLPPIILPEFDITGKEQPQPPDFSKGEFSEDLGFFEMIRDPNLEERESSVLNRGRKPEVPMEKPPSSLKGKVIASYGKFVTPSVESWIGRLGRNMDVNVSGNYSSSDGHVAFSEYRRAGLDASVSWKLDSQTPVLKDARVSAFGGIEGYRYNFYGSRTPSVARSVHHVSVGVGTMSAFRPWDLAYDMQVRWRAYSVDDFAKSTENEVSVGLVASRAFGSVSARANVDMVANFLNSAVRQNNPIFVSVVMEGEGLLFPNFQLDPQLGLGATAVKIALFGAILIFVQVIQDLKNDTFIVLKWPLAVQSAFFVFIGTLTVVFGDFGDRPFIYFQF